jgi:hypothetical protein
MQTAGAVHSPLHSKAVDTTALLLRARSLASAKPDGVDSTPVIAENLTIESSILHTTTFTMSEAEDTSVVMTSPNTRGVTPSTDRDDSHKPNLPNTQTYSGYPGISESASPDSYQDSPRKIERNIRTYKSETYLDQRRSAADPVTARSRDSRGAQDQNFYISEDYPPFSEEQPALSPEASKWPSLACADRLVARICSVGRLPLPPSVGRTPTPDAFSDAGRSSRTATFGDPAPPGAGGWQQVLSDLATDT